MIKAGIIGATGYAGAELTRMLTMHEDAVVCACGSVSHIGKKISDIYPSLRSFCDETCVSPEQVIEKSDVVFAAVAAGISQDLAAACDVSGKKFIDLGADFRLKDEQTYTKWYGGAFTHRDLHEKAVYGLPELYREKIAKTNIIGNPGCYPTSAALALAPALRAHAVEKDGIIIDSKSGVTGSGAAPKESSHYPNCNEAFAPYKIASHRHTPEIEQTCSDLYGSDIRLVFTPHLLPVNRGIISTVYAKTSMKLDSIRKLYEEFYAGERFVRVLPDGCTANLRDVRCSNFCDISLHIDEHTGTLIIVSTIDNMVKGAAGQAIQNMNIMYGIDESTGLLAVPTSF